MHMADRLDVVTEEYAAAMPAHASTPPHHDELDALLRQLAAKYIWWEPPSQAVSRPRRVIAQVMDIGDYRDVQKLAHLIGEDGFLSTLEHAEPGWFTERSWHYWNYRLKRSTLENMPARPIRDFADAQ